LYDKTIDHSSSAKHKRAIEVRAPDEKLLTFGPSDYTMKSRAKKHKREQSITKPKEIDTMVVKVSLDDGRCHASLSPGSALHKGTPNFAYSDEKGTLLGVEHGNSSSLKKKYQR